jgi:hypothetical protein
MAMNLRRAGSVFGTGVLLLTAMGCGAGAGSEEQEAELGRTTQGLDVFLCMGDCESEYNAEYYACQIGPGDFWCLTRAQSELDLCLSFCASWENYPPPEPPSTSCPGGGPQPPEAPVQSGCDSAYWNWCNAWCEDCTDGEVRTFCLDDCHNLYCSGSQPPQQPTQPPQQPQPLPCAERVADACYGECAWAHDWDAVTCQEECTYRRCGAEWAAICRGQVSGNCAASCDGAWQWEPCYEQCLFQTCGNG